MLHKTVLSAVAASILATTSVFAQIPPGANAPIAPPTSGDLRSGDGMRHRVRELHDRLGISPAQQPQWDALIGTLRDNAAAMRASPAVQAVRSGQLDAVQALRAAADVARQRADAMQRTIAPLEALYAVMSPEQRRMADTDLVEFLHAGGPHRG